MARPARPVLALLTTLAALAAHHYKSPWYRGSHRRMINFGCTRAPYYSPSPRCQRQRGFHHGVDVAMKCGTPLFAGRQGRVVKPRSAGALGPAYGSKAFRRSGSSTSAAPTERPPHRVVTVARR